MEILLATIVGVVVIALSFIIYHQQLLLNEVNKRLLVMALEAKTHEQVTYEEVIEKLLNRESLQMQYLDPNPPKQFEAVEDEPINPFDLFNDNGELS